ncbi:MAG: hypothetical protein ABSG51_18310 [Terracidiphilus sp.]|jgi:hypothetical protein
MQLKSVVVSIIAITATLSLAFPLTCGAQSFPAGQVTYRAQIHSPVTTAGRDFAAFVKSVSGSDTASDKSGRCRYDISNPNIKSAYTYATWFPTLGTGCLSPIILNYFAVEKSAVAANGVQYLYNAQQSTSQVNADLFTATFPLGFQAVLAGTATAGSSQTTPTTSSVTSTSTSTTKQTDSVSTAVSKIENGGDFNLRFPFPVVSHFGQGYALDGRILPNLGFTINKFGAQDTITESTEYTFNVPFEFYGQTTSIDPSNPAIVFVDLKPSGEVLSSAFAQSIGLTRSRAFFLGEAAVGVEFAQKVRVSLQYFVGPHQIYQTTNSTGTTTTATHIGGFHLAVSFAPQKPGM